jgi:hypothetical protein
MLSESSHIGKWSHITCNKKNIAICHKNATPSLTFLHKILLENKKELEEIKKGLEETRKKSEENILKFNKFLNNLANNK